MQIVSSEKAHGGTQHVCRHAASSTGTDMVFSVFVPPHEEGETVPVVWFLSGLSCTHANVTEKGEYRRACAELGLVFVAPDTSPRGATVPDDPDGAFDLGLGAGFYLDATRAPFATHYKMRRYVVDELPRVVAANFPIDPVRQSIMGHSMGGHGALTIGLSYPERFRAVSAFAPIVAPTQVPWGRKAFDAYLGPEGPAWRAHDAVALIEDGRRLPALLVDQGGADPFLDQQLKPDLLRQACDAAGIPLELRLHPGYAHGYGFVSTFMADQLAWHRSRHR